MLRRRRLGEADDILALLSPDPGRFDAVARGARKPTSRWVSLVEPFTLLHGQFARGRSLCYLSEARIIRSHGRLRQDLDLLLWGSYLLDLFLNALPEDLPGEVPFELLTGSLLALEEGAPPALLVLWLEMRLLQLLGFAPQVEQCNLCGSSEVRSFSVNAGGVVCAACGHGVSLPPPARGALRLLGTCSLRAALRLRLDAGTQNTLERVLQSQLEAHIPNHLKSAEVLRSVRR